MNQKSFALYSVVPLGIGCLLVVFGLFILTNPALASMANTQVPTPQILWASVYVPKPTITSQDIQVVAPIETPIEASISSDALSLAEEVVNDSPVNLNNQSFEGQVPDDGRWIDVNLSGQQMYAYEGGVVVNSFIVSSGLPGTPTVTGEYRIYIKVPMQDMSGPGYYLRDVPWVMYFYDEYGFHGTYWHNNFGTPMSRGCVNLRIEDAEWLYNWASVGTRVSVHY